MQVNNTASLRKTIAESDVVLFAGISLGSNPAHLDEPSEPPSDPGRFNPSMACRSA